MPKTTTNKTEIEKLKAELSAMKAETEALKAALTSASSKSDPRRTAWMAPTPEKQMAKANTLLGKAQRMGREDLLDATYKAVRAIKHSDVALLLNKLVEEASTDGGIDGKATPENLFEKFTTKRAYNRAK